MWQSVKRNQKKFELAVKIKMFKEFPTTSFLLTRLHNHYSDGDFGIFISSIEWKKSARTNHDTIWSALFRNMQSVKSGDN